MVFGLPILLVSATHYRKFDTHRLGVARLHSFLVQNHTLLDRVWGPPHCLVDTPKSDTKLFETKALAHCL